MSAVLETDKTHFFRINLFLKRYYGTLVFGNHVQATTKGQCLFANQLKKYIMYQENMQLRRRIKD